MGGPFQLNEASTNITRNPFLKLLRFSPLLCRWRIQTIKLGKTIEEDEGIQTTFQGIFFWPLFIQSLSIAREFLKKSFLPNLFYYNII